MKKIAFVLLLMLSFLITKGQKISFTDTTNVWNIFETDCGSTYLHYSNSINNTYSGSIFTHGNNYKILSYHWYLSPKTSYIREDTIAKKVYIIPNNLFHEFSSVTDTNEYVLYDYNWTVGDSVLFHFPTISTSKCFVTNLDSVQINSVWHKRWHFVGTDTIYMPITLHDSVQYNIIEGVGCLNDFFYAILPLSTNSGLCSISGATSVELICFTNHGIHPVFSASTQTYGLEPGTPTHVFDNAASCSLSEVKSVSARNQKVTFYPNPVTTESIWKFDEIIRDGLLTVFDCLGQAVYQVKIENLHEIPFSNIAIQPGLYTYSIFDKTSGERCYGKLIVGN